MTGVTPAQAERHGQVSAEAQAAYNAFWSSDAMGNCPPSPLGREESIIRRAWQAVAEAVAGARLSQSVPGNGERPAVYARFLRASYPTLPDRDVADAWRSASPEEVAFWREVETATEASQ